MIDEYWKFVHLYTLSTDTFILLFERVERLRSLLHPLPSIILANAPISLIAHCTSGPSARLSSRILSTCDSQLCYAL